MPVGHHDFPCASREETFDGRIDLFSQKPAPLIVKAPRRKNPVVVGENSRNPFHIGHEIDLHGGQTINRSLADRKSS